MDSTYSRGVLSCLLVLFPWMTRIVPSLVRSWSHIFGDLYFMINFLYLVFFFLYFKFYNVFRVLKESGQSALHMFKCLVLLPRL